MRDVVEFRTGSDGSLVLAPVPGEGYEYDDLTVELSGRTIHITTPDGERTVGLEAVHGERI